MQNRVAFQPHGYTSVTPWIVTNDTAALLDFIVDAFEGQELARVPTDDGTIGHAEVRVGDTVVLAFDRRPEWPTLTSLLRVWVADSDAAVARAIECGGVVVTPLSSNAFGQRGARVRDPWGNIWWIETQIEELSEEQMWSRLNEPTYAEEMRTAQATLDAELSNQTHDRSSAPVRRA